MDLSIEDARATLKSIKELIATYEAKGDKFGVFEMTKTKEQLEKKIREAGYTP
jgi:hypothetical protein